MAAPSGPEVRAARAFISREAPALARHLNPRKFATAARELDMGFKDVLALIKQVNRAPK